VRRAQDEWRFEPQQKDVNWNRFFLKTDRPDSFLLFELTVLVAKRKPDPVAGAPASRYDTCHSTCCAWLGFGAAHAC
jgi:hypothetical protein